MNRCTLLFATRTVSCSQNCIMIVYFSVSLACGKKHIIFLEIKTTSQLCLWKCVRNYHPPRFISLSEAKQHHAPPFETTYDKILQFINFSRNRRVETNYGMEAKDSDAIQCAILKTEIIMHSHTRNRHTFKTNSHTHTHSDTRW